ncbi:MAG: S-layer homology domain-containing protein [Clostridia bacterium]|nr:S-layer homology domain-containing protein [Clostridia bacterium]
MKKLVSVVLVLAMSTTFLFAMPCAAAGVSFTSADIGTMINLIGDNMPETQARRSEVFGVMSLYMSTDAGMQTLIDTVEALSDPGYVMPENLVSIVNRLNASLGGDGLAAYGDKLLFVLDVIKAIPEDNREDAINAFIAAQDAADLGSSFADESKVDANAAFQAALHSVYEAFVSNEGDSNLESHGVGPNTILRLVLALQGQMMLTDAANGTEDFALKTIDSTFATRLSANVSEHFTNINGKTDLSGTNIVKAIINAVNSATNDTIKANMKTVLGSSEVELYTRYVAPSSPSGGSSSSSGNGRPNTESDKANMSTTVKNWTEPAAPPAAGNAYVYTDTANHWAKDYIGALSERGIFKGYEDGSFKPDLGITREEIAVALTRAMYMEKAAEKAKANDFTDVDKIAAWAKGSVNLTVNAGVFKGYDDGSFKPQKTIIREEMVAVIIRMFSTNISTTKLTYTDTHTIGDWAKGYVEKASTLSIVVGYPDGSFQPKNNITRAEAAKILYNFMHYAGLL